VAKVKYEGSKEMVIPVPIDFKDNNKVIQINSSMDFVIYEQNKKYYSH
jgi:hypothetical protein